MTRHPFRRRAGGFLLLETMLGVAVFALGVLALARCMGLCLDAQVAQRWDERARMALENRMAEIEAGAVVLESFKEERLGGMFRGIALRQSRTPLRLRDAAGRELPGLLKIQLEAVWREASGQQQSKGLMLYVPG